MGMAHTLLRAVGVVKDPRRDRLVIRQHVVVNDRDASVDRELSDYIAGIDARYRSLFDRVDRLIREVEPGVDVVISYGMPTYRAGGRRLNVGVWQHGVSIYGARRDQGAFVDRHPELHSSKGTIRLAPDTAAEVGDDELRDLFRSALAD
jgi:uncharacterized protein YdhG (YjbR/CyaY superfamily)